MSQKCRKRHFSGLFRALCSKIWVLEFLVKYKRCPFWWNKTFCRQNKNSQNYISRDIYEKHVFSCDFSAFCKKNRYLGKLIAQPSFKIFSLFFCIRSEILWAYRIQRGTTSWCSGREHGGVQSRAACFYWKKNDEKSIFHRYFSEKTTFGLYHRKAL